MPNVTASQANIAASVTNGAALANADKLADEAGKVTANVPTEAPKVAPRVAHSTLVSNIVAAAGSFKTAINLEISVALAVFAQYRAASVGAKKELYSVYKDAGYDCEVGGGGKDYKTVNRRIGYSAMFFNSLKPGTVEEWMGAETSGQEAIQTLINKLTVDYNFRSMEAVAVASGQMTTAAKKTARKAATAPAPAAAPTPAAGPSAGPQGPQGGLPAPAPQEPVAKPTATDQKTIDAAKARFDKGQAPTERQLVTLAKYGIDFEAPKPDAADQNVINAMTAAGRERMAAEVQNRRETDNEKWIRCNYEGATLLIPADMTTEALSEMAIKLMTAAHGMKGKTVDAALLVETFAAAEAH